MFVHTYVLDFKSIPELNRTADDNFCLANLATLFRAVGTEEGGRRKDCKSGGIGITAKKACDSSLIVFTGVRIEVFLLPDSHSRICRSPHVPLGHIGWLYSFTLACLWFLFAPHRFSDIPATLSLERTSPISRGNWLHFADGRWVPKLLAGWQTTFWQIGRPTFGRWADRQAANIIQFQGQWANAHTSAH